MRSHTTKRLLLVLVVAIAAVFSATQVTQAASGNGDARKAAVRACKQADPSLDRKQCKREAKAALKSAGQACKSEREADRAAFEQAYGTNKNKHNAFGKCVVSKVKADLEDGDGGDEEDEDLDDSDDDDSVTPGDDDSGDDTGDDSSDE